MKRRPGPLSEFKALKRFIGQIEKHFLADYLVAPVLRPPTHDESLNVAAYVVLAHGAFENFFEGVGLWVVQCAEKSWVYKKRVTRCTASLLLYRKAPEADIAPGVSIYDNVRINLAEAKADVSKLIEQNHGIATKHLRSMFGPLGIDISDDAVQVASLELLVSLRHQWAHQYRFGAKVTKSANDVKQAVADCLLLAEGLANSAAKCRP